MKKLLVIRGQSHFRTVTDEDVHGSLLPSERDAEIESVDLDTREFESGIESGYWEQEAAYVRHFVGDVLQRADDFGSSEIRYLGIEEVPIAISLGAYLSDERLVRCQDWDRKGGFRWPDDSAPVEFDVMGLPGEKVPSTGDVVLRVEITSPVESADVDEVAPRANRFADIAIRPRSQDPRPALIRSNQDVENFRNAIRDALARIDLVRPNTQVIHLFIAGPVSVCIAAGQALRLRNGRPVQTYRYRAKATPRMQPAILLSPDASDEPERPLTHDERRDAAGARVIWNQALDELVEHAFAQRSEADTQLTWPGYLDGKLRSSYDGTLLLPPVWELVSSKDHIDPDDCQEFYFNSKENRWYLGDRMMLMMSRAAGGDESKLRRFARAFFWHEYLHEYQRLDKQNSIGIGGFPNCLERIDYVADFYSLLHQLDFEMQRRTEMTDDEIRLLLSQCITEALDSFWTFEPPAPTRWLQQRRLRRYLNWYWRREQIQRSGTLAEAVQLLCHQPTIEVSGLPLSTDRRRVFLDFSKVERSDRLEVGLVDEANRLVRCPESTTLSISQMLKAFSDHDRQAIDQFFVRLYTSARR